MEINIDVTEIFPTPRSFFGGRFWVASTGEERTVFPSPCAGRGRRHTALSSAELSYEWCVMPMVGNRNYYLACPWSISMKLRTELRRRA
jgi:hypothetical protein